MSIETFWQPVLPHAVEPEDVPTDNVLQARRVNIMAPVMDSSLAWLRKNPRSSAGDMSRGMNIPMHKAKAHCKRLVSHRKAVELCAPTCTAQCRPRYFYTATEPQGYVNEQ